METKTNPGNTEEILVGGAVQGVSKSFHTTVMGCCTPDSPFSLEPSRLLTSRAGMV